MMKKALTALLTFALLFSLTAPALAWEYPPAKYPAIQEYLAFYRSCDDDDTQALADYIDGVLALDPNLPETFDADAYFDKKIAAPAMGITKGNWFAQNGPSYNEDFFRAEMLDHFLTENYRTWREANAAAALAARYPEEWACFDADAWFAGYYGGVMKVSKADYMTRCGLTEDGFRQAMFAEWATGRGSFFNDLCVTVDGVPIQFQFYRGLSGEIAVPRAENDRLLVPLRAVSECLGFTVDYLPETRQVTCAGTGGTVTFTLDSAAYSGGRLDAAPFAEDGVTYLPLRALGEALGCTVTWNQEFRTAALHTPA